MKCENVLALSQCLIKAAWGLLQISSVRPTSFHLVFNGLTSTPLFAYCMVIFQRLRRDNIYFGSFGTFSFKTICRTGTSVSALLAGNSVLFSVHSVNKSQTYYGIYPYHTSFIITTSLAGPFQVG